MSNKFVIDLKPIIYFFSRFLQGEIRLWDTRQSRHVQAFKDHTDFISDLMLANPHGAGPMLFSTAGASICIYVSLYLFNDLFISDPNGGPHAFHVHYMYIYKILFSY